MIATDIVVVVAVLQLVPVHLIQPMIVLIVLANVVAMV
jgi:hypothetical protein